MRTLDLSWRGDPRDLPPLCWGVVVPAVLNVRNFKLVVGIPHPPQTTRTHSLTRHPLLQHTGRMCERAFGRGGRLLEGQQLRPGVLAQPRRGRLHVHLHHDGGHALHRQRHCHRLPHGGLYADQAAARRGGRKQPLFGVLAVCDGVDHPNTGRPSNRGGVPRDECTTSRVRDGLDVHVIQSDPSRGDVRVDVPRTAEEEEGKSPRARDTLGHPQPELFNRSRRCSTTAVTP